MCGWPFLGSRLWLTVLSDENQNFMQPRWDMYLRFLYAFPKPSKTHHFHLGWTSAYQLPRSIFHALFWPQRKLPTDQILPILNFPTIHSIPLPSAKEICRISFNNQLTRMKNQISTSSIANFKSCSRDSELITPNIAFHCFLSTRRKL